MLTLTFSTGAPAGPNRSHRLVNTWRDDEGRVLARAFTSGQQSWIEWPQLGLFEFEQGSTAVRVTPAAGAPRGVIEATFARALQPVILQAQGWLALHASAVSTSSGVIALCGRARAGKSTLAVALALSGHAQIADDALVFSIRDGRVRVLPLPFESELAPSAREYFAAQAGAPRAALPAGAVPDLTAVFVVSPATHDSFRPVTRHLSAVEAFSVLLVHAHCFDESDRRHTEAMVGCYLTVAAEVPVYELTYPMRFDRIADTVAAIIATERRREV